MLRVGPRSISPERLVSCLDDRMKDWGPLDTPRLLGGLVVRGVDFVVVGGIAAVLHGSPRMTEDADVVFATDDANLNALGKALTDLEAKLAEVEDDVPFVPDARTLRSIELLTLETNAGKLDLLRQPSGAPPYNRLRRDADRYDVGAFSLLVASVPDLIAMKRSAGRPKDLADIAELEVIARLRRESSSRNDISRSAQLGPG